MKKRNKIASILLTVAISLTVFVTSVFAAGQSVTLSYNSSADQYEGSGYNGLISSGSIYTAFGPTYRSNGQIMNNYFQVTLGNTRYIYNYYLSIDPTYWADAGWSNISGTQPVKQVTVTQEVDGDYLRRYQFGDYSDYLTPYETGAVQIHLKWLGNTSRHYMRYLNFNGGQDNYMFWAAPGTSDNGTDPTRVEFYSTSSVIMN